MKGWDATAVKRLEDQGRVRGIPALASPCAAPAAIKEGPKRRGPSTWERAYYAERIKADVDSGAVEWCAYEGLSFQIGTAQTPCWYTPDWPLVRGGRVELHEVKGHMREAARVRMAALGRLVPWARLFVATGGPGKWVVSEWRAGT